VHDRLIAISVFAVVVCYATLIALAVFDLFQAPSPLVVNAAGGALVSTSVCLLTVVAYILVIGRHPTWARVVFGVLVFIAMAYETLANWHDVGTITARVPGVLALLVLVMLSLVVVPPLIYMSRRPGPEAKKDKPKH